jgi:hypothetical protein
VLLFVTLQRVLICTNCIGTPIFFVYPEYWAGRGHRDWSVSSEVQSQMLTSVVLKRRVRGPCFVVRLVQLIGPTVTSGWLVSYLSRHGLKGCKKDPLVFL